ncbi:hypothetical protein COBT_000639 [Conglomerata obtusa]
MSFILSTFIHNNEKNIYTLVTRYIIGCIATFFNLFWDLKMDWGIFRKKMMYHPMAYVFITIYNVFCRLLWIFIEHGGIMVAFFEVTRRFLWTLIRVEHEHLNNCDRLKALSMIELPLADLFYRRDKESKAESCESEDKSEMHDSSVIEE